jgi:hypothetical protein
MSPGSYREEYEALLAGQAARRAGQAPTPRRMTSMATAESTASDVSNRIRAIELTTPKGEPPGLKIEEVIAKLADDNEDPGVRQAALAKLKELEFFGSLLDPYRPDYLEALKKAAQSTISDLALRALETLAIHKEPFARDILLGFLKDPKSAIISIAQAIQLLAYDDHSDVISTVRNLLEQVKDPQVIEQAVRLLSSDTGSEGLFAKFLSDKSQPKEVRTLSASSLHNINPARFAAVAKKIIDDDDEDDDLRAACLSTLTHFSDYVKERLNKTFARKIKKLQERSSSVNLKATASRFLQRLTQEQK